MTQREIDLDHELSAALIKVDDQRELLKLAKEENEEKRKDIVYLATEKAKLEERIKRLEEDSQRLNWLLNRGIAWRDCYNDWWKEGEWLYASQSALETIDKAKEDK